MTPIDLWPDSTRFTTESERRLTRHSFSFGAHYAPDNTGFGALVAHNDERLPAGTGYPDHPHSDVEIVSLVLCGSLRHTSTVGTATLAPFEVQRLSAGSGVVHSEVSDSQVNLRFLQAWVRPDEPGTTPSYLHSPGGVSPGELVEVAGPSSIPLGCAGASLHVARASEGDSLALPDAARLHVFVASGSGLLGDRELGADDAARLLGEGGRTFTATAPETVVAVWALP